MPRPRLEYLVLPALGLSLAVGGLIFGGTAQNETQPALVSDETPATAVTAGAEPAAKPAAKTAKKYSPTAVSLSISDSDGSGIRPLDILPEYAYQGSPKWSPDGKRIALNVWKEGEGFTSGKIALVDADGGNARVLGDGLMPSFSPRGDRIAFSRPGADHGVWVMSVEAPEKDLQRIDENGWGTDWSRDGRLVYSTVTAGGANLVVVDPADGRRQFLFDEQESPYKRIFWSMAWSPDSRRIIFKGLNTDDKYEIGIVDARGAKRGLVHRIEGEIPATFAWRADGSRVLFLKPCPERASRMQMYLLDPGSEDPSQLLPGQDPKRNYVDIAWSPDGKKIAASSIEPPSKALAARANIPPEALKAHFVANFRSKRPDATALRLIENRDPRYVTPSDGGLRVRLPYGEEKPDQAGISRKFAIRGDFEVIAVFHSLTVSKPAQGWGAGLDLLLMMGTSPLDIILVERHLSAAGQSVFATKHGHVDQGGTYQWKIAHQPPNDAAAGKFKLVRKGAVVYYLFAEYGTDDYELFDEKVITAEDVHFLKFAAVASDRQAGSDVFLEKLEIRAAELPDEQPGLVK